MMSRWLETARKVLPRSMFSSPSQWNPEVLRSMMVATTLYITTSWNSSVECMSLRSFLRVLSGSSGKKNFDTMGRIGLLDTRPSASTTSSSV